MTDFDKRAHYIYSFMVDGVIFRKKVEEVAYQNCGNPLQAYYCEDRLYLTRCLFCGTMAFAKARTPEDAALKALGVERGEGK